MTLDKVTYGLTFRGISKMLEILKIPGIVCTQAKKFKEELKKLPENIAYGFIIDAAILKNESDDYQSHHAISVFVKRKLQELTFVINDSEGNYYDCKQIKKIYSNDNKMNIFFSQIMRQEKFTCHCFAIDDCKALDENPALFEEIVAHTDLPITECAEVKKLPERMMALTKVDKENKLYLQLQLIEYLLLSK